MSAELDTARYIALKSFRKSGEEVATPVWIVPEGDAYYFFTQLDSGKVKRMRRNGAVQVAPCSFRGKVKGEWCAATATIDDSETTLSHIMDLVAKKYGVEFSLFSLFRGKEAFMKGRTTIKLSLSDS